MESQDRYIIPLSLVGRDENISGEHARRLARRLEDDGKITVQRTPTGRMLLNISGYMELRHAILESSPRAA